MLLRLTTPAVIVAPCQPLLTTACLHCLQCQSMWLWVPRLESNQPTDIFELSLQQSQNMAESYTRNLAAGSCSSILAAELAGAACSRPATAHSSDTSAHATQLAAPAGGLAPVIRRCSRLIVEESELASFSSMAADDGDWDFDGKASIAGLTETDRETWAQQWRQQQQQRLSRRVRRKSRRPSYIVTDHVICVDPGRPLVHQAEQNGDPPGLPEDPLGMPSSLLSATAYESVHPGPLTIPLESPLEEGGSSMEDVLASFSLPAEVVAGHAIISGAGLSNSDGAALDQVGSSDRSACCPSTAPYSVAADGTWDMQPLHTVYTRKQQQLPLQQHATAGGLEALQRAASCKAAVPSSRPEQLLSSAQLSSGTNQQAVSSRPARCSSMGPPAIPVRHFFTTLPSVHYCCSICYKRLADCQPLACLHCQGADNGSVISACVSTSLW
jgi:hypothetical protein